MIVFIPFLIAASLVILPHADADEKLDAASSEALTKTLELLHDPVKRGDALKENDKTREAGAAVKHVGGSAENETRIYELSALIFERMVKESGGDPVKMAELLEQAQRNPASFAATLTEKEKQELKTVSTQVEQRSVPKKP